MSNRHHHFTPVRENSLSARADKFVSANADHGFMKETVNVWSRKSGITSASCAARTHPSNELLSKQARPALGNKLATIWYTLIIKLSNAMPRPKKHVKNSAAVALSKLGASKGGLARAKKLSAEERSRIARKAARSRWAEEKR
jgi:hypothetical protein